MQDSEIDFGSVCSGIEAASVAWENLGWHAAWVAEVDPFPAHVLHAHYGTGRPHSMPSPDEPGLSIETADDRRAAIKAVRNLPLVPASNRANLGDMTTVAALVRDGTVRAPRVLVGGTPCQSFSVAGLRAGLSDPRGGLTIAFVELANEIDAARHVRGEPGATIVWENVPGVLSSEDNAFGCFLGGLAGEDGPLEPPGGRWANAGCVFGPQRNIAWRILDAQYFGVAQRRRRVFVVASPRDGANPAEILFEFDGERRDFEPRRKTRQDFAGPAGYGSSLQPVAGTLQASGKAAGSATQRDVESGLLVPVLAFGGNNTSGPIDVATAQRAKGGTGHGEFESETFLVHASGYVAPVAPTLSARTKGGGGLVAVETVGTLRATDGGADVTLAQAGHLIAFHGSQDPDVSGDVTHPVGRNHGQETCVAYSTKLHNTKSNQAGKFYEEYTPGLDGMSPPPAVVSFRAAGQDGMTPTDLSPPISASEGGGSGVPSVAYPNDAFIFESRFARNGRGAPSEIVPPLKAQSGETGKGDAAPLVATPTMEVRRLTPTECERLQAFPDGWTMVKYRGKQAQDGPRYKALGNSMCVFNMAWIGRRIDRAFRA